MGQRVLLCEIKHNRLIKLLLYVYIHVCTHTAAIIIFVFVHIYTQLKYACIHFMCLWIHDCAHTAAISIVLMHVYVIVHVFLSIESHTVHVMLDRVGCSGWWDVQCDEQIGAAAFIYRA